MGHWCYPCAYSNGFVNAVVYGMQKRSICRRCRSGARPSLHRAPSSWERHTSPSFHVGFGPESCVSPFSPTITTVTQPSEHSEQEERLWAPFIAAEDGVSATSSTNAGSSAAQTSTRASETAVPELISDAGCKRNDCCASEQLVGTSNGGVY